MTYQEFKQKLLYSILHCDEASDKQIRLLEKGEVCTGLHIQDICSCFEKGYLEKCDMIMEEDLLDVTWSEGKHGCNRQWNVREYFIRYLKEGWQGVIPDIVFELDRISKQNDKESETSCGSSIADKNRLLIRAMNYERNLDKIPSGIYWKFGDIALVLYEMIMEPDVDLISLQINRESLWGINLPKGILLFNALRNTCSKMPLRLCLITGKQEDYDEQGTCFLKEEGYDRMSSYHNILSVYHDSTCISEGCKKKDADYYKLTNSIGINGALTVFYPNVQERLAWLLGGDYYVSFPNIHEVLIHPLASCHVGSLKQMVRERNAVAKRELVLTDKVYRYCGCRKYLVEV